MTTTQLVATMNLPAYIFLAGIVFAIIILSLRSLAFNWYDPIFVINGTVIGFSLAIMAYSYFVDRTISSSDLSYIALSTFSFFVGAHIVRVSLRTRFQRHIQISSVKGHDFGIMLVKMFLFVSSCLLFAAFITKAYTVGLPILSTDPDLQKSVATTGGYGGLGRIIETLTYCNLVLLFYLRRMKLLSKLTGLYFILPILAIVASGSKSAFLTVFFAYFFANLYVALKKGEKPNFISFKFFAFSILGVMAYAALVMFLKMVNLDFVGTEARDLVIRSLLIRLIASGEGVYYFFMYLRGLLVHNPLDYLNSYLIQPLFAPFRIVSYQKALGAEMGYMLSNSELLGPYPTMYVEGWVFFGYFGGIVYCLLLGCFFSYCRFMSLSAGIRNEVARMLFFCIANILILEIGKDMMLFAGYVLNYALIVPAVLIVSRVLLTVGMPSGGIVRNLSNRER